MVDIPSLLLVGTGFLLGLGHSLDPDHVVAISALVCNSPSLRKSIASAVAWGTGHSVTLFLVGLLVLAFRIAIPDSVVQALELAAAAMLVALGVLVMKPFVAGSIRGKSHRRQIDSENHATLDSSGTPHAHAHVHKSVATGVLQGLAGSAAVMLVVLTTVNSAVLGLIFIALFGVGVVLGMVGISCVIGTLLTYTASRLKRVHEKIQAVTGLISIGFGIFIFMQVVFQGHV
ncbi:MAG: sulfite exporter TauE/SafE family protein [Candidatus Bathyarchaeia archaeon]